MITAFTMLVTVYKHYNKPHFKLYYCFSHYYEIVYFIDQNKKGKQYQ